MSDGTCVCVCVCVRGQFDVLIKRQIMRPKQTIEPKQLIKLSNNSAFLSLFLSIFLPRQTHDHFQKCIIYRNQIIILLFMLVWSSFSMMNTIKTMTFNFIKVIKFNHQFKQKQMKQFNWNIFYFINKTYLSFGPKTGNVKFDFLSFL